uniref:Uncharacterized protein n=1 Tax=Anopheles darlingi TaxID=43151 RepID=A0A2M4CWP6_ANODA
MVGFAFNRHDKANAARFMLVLWIVQSLSSRCLPWHLRFLVLLLLLGPLLLLQITFRRSNNVIDHFVRTFIVGWCHPFSVLLLVSGSWDGFFFFDLGCFGMVWGFWFFSVSGACVFFLEDSGFFFCYLPPLFIHSLPPLGWIGWLHG